MANAESPATAPPSAIPIWTDGRRVFALVGGTIIAYPFSDGGLSKILSLAKRDRIDYAGTPIAAPRPPLSGTPLQHASAEALLRKRGILR